MNTFISLFTSSTEEQMLQISSIWPIQLWAIYSRTNRYLCYAQCFQKLQIFTNSSISKFFSRLPLCAQSCLQMPNLENLNSLLIPAVKLTQILPAHKNKEKKSSFSKELLKKTKQKLEKEISSYTDVKYRTVCHISEVFAFSVPFCFFTFFFFFNILLEEFVPHL